MRNYFKSTPKLTGSLLNVSFVSKTKNGEKEKDGVVFLKIVKQKTWNDQKKVGGFADGDTVSVKLNLPEIASLIRSLEDTQHTFNFFHSSGTQTTSGTVNYFELPPKQGQKEATKGFSVRVKKGNDEFKAYLTVPEGWDLAAWLKYCREHIYNGVYSLNKARFDKFKKKEVSETRETLEFDDPSNPPEIVEDSQLEDLVV